MFSILVFVACTCYVLGETPHHLCDEVSRLDCLSEYIPYEANEQVCGSDGVTYNNFCEYSQARCKTPQISIAKVGDCSATAPTTTVASSVVTATTPPISGPSPPATTAGTTTIGTTTPDTVLQVFCAAKDAVNCPPTLDPVCGTDKNFYLNECEFTKARCDNPAMAKQDVVLCSPGSG